MKLDYKMLRVLLLKNNWIIVNSKLLGYSFSHDEFFVKDKNGLVYYDELDVFFYENKIDKFEVNIIDMTTDIKIK